MHNANHQQGICQKNTQNQHVLILFQTNQLYWLKSKGLFRGLIQVTLLFQALLVSLLILAIPILLRTSPILGPIAIILLFIAIVWILLVAIPYLVPVHTLCAYSAECASIKIIKQCLGDKNVLHVSDVFNFAAETTDEETTEEVSIDVDGCYVPPALTEPFLPHNDL